MENYEENYEKWLDEKIAEDEHKEWLEYKHEKYLEESAEARACGYEFPSWSEYIGESNLRENAEHKTGILLENDTYDLF